MPTLGDNTWVSKAQTSPGLSILYVTQDTMGSVQAGAREGVKALTGTSRLRFGSCVLQSLLRFGKRRDGVWRRAYQETVTFHVGKPPVSKDMTVEMLRGLREDVHVQKLQLRHGSICMYQENHEGLALLLPRGDAGSVPWLRLMYVPRVIFTREPPSCTVLYSPRHAT